MSPPHRDHPEGEATGMIVDVPSKTGNNQENPRSSLSSDFLPLEMGKSVPVALVGKSYLSTDVAASTSACGSDMDEEKQHDTDIDSVTYIDFVPPPPPPVPPPAKYKLWLLILILVYLGVWFANEAQVLPALTMNGWLAPQAALFLFMMIQISVSTYAALDLLVRVLTIQINGKKYGMEAWLKMGRTHVWLQNTFNKGNFITDLLICIVQVLEEGFEIFNPTDSLQQQHKPSDTPEFPKIKDACHAVLKIQYNVKRGYADKYEEWSEKIGRRAATQPGFIRIEREHRLVLENKVKCQRTHTAYLTFENLQTLNDWMTSPIRQQLVDELKPMLEDSTDVVQLVANRHLPDAWTDLLVRQGEFVPPRPPQKWKVLWLTTCGLFLSVLILNQIMPYYYEKWGMVVPYANERLVAFVNALFSTFCVSYIMQPLLLMQFSHWLQTKQPKKGEEREPWRTLNDGIENMWIKLLITVVFFGSMGIKWALNG